MNILITNDDGIEAAGLQNLVRALHEKAGATIYICAPDGQRSATAHGITMNRPITVEEVPIEDVEVAYQISGLPADCIKLGLIFLARKGISIDMVFSGINHGGNLGTDTLYSGTVSAALEGSLNGVPSVSVSVDSHQATHFEYICELAVNAAKAIEKQIAEGTADPRIVLNINTPDLPKEEIKGLKYTVLGPREYDEIFVPAHMDSEEARLKRDAARAASSRKADSRKESGSEADSRKESGRKAGSSEAEAAPMEAAQEGLRLEDLIPGAFRYSGTPVYYDNLPANLDVVANQDGYASITPIHTDLTAYDMVEKIQQWNLG